MKWGLKSNTQSFVSPLSGYVQTTSQPGARWQCSLTLQTLAEADAALLQAWLAQLRGQENRALLYPFQRPLPRGTIVTGGVSVSGTPAFGATQMNLAGCGAAKTLLAGDFFTVAQELKMVTGNATADGSGNIAALAFEPPVRALTGWTNGLPVTLAQPPVRMIQQQDVVEWQGHPPAFSDHELSFLEVWS
jgi:hypothetical protein